jgi:ribosome-associated translation inhibitor RaiA
MPKDLSGNLQVQINTHHFDLSPAEVAKFRDGLNGLARTTENFPVADLRVFVSFRSRNNEYAVKTTLILPGATLVASDHDPVAHAAYERCVDNLVRELKDYKDRLGQVPERQKAVGGTRQDVQPTLDPDPAAIDAAVAEGDYAAFRQATLGYEEPVRRRVGRWVERDEAADGAIGRRFTIADVVEEVFLTAFETYAERPKEVRFGDWLEGLIDSAVKGLLRHPDELENVSLARTLQGVAPTREEK